MKGEMNPEQSFSAEFANDLPLDVQAICDRMNGLGISVRLKDILGDEKSDLLTNITGFAWMYDGDIDEFYDALDIPVEFRQ
jgi:hypothetical protein